MSSIECITLYSVSVLSSPIVGCCWAGSVISTDALLFPGYFSQCNIINFFCVSEPCHLGQWASCVLRSRQLDTTLKLLCAVSAWKGSSTLSRGEYLSTNHSTFQTYVSEPCHLGQWASCALRSKPLDATLKCRQWKGSSTFTFYIAGSWY